MDAAGTMLLSEVNLGGGRGGAGGSAEPLPSSRVQLNDGRVVNVTGNVSMVYSLGSYPSLLWSCVNDKTSECAAASLFFPEQTVSLPSVEICYTVQPWHHSMLLKLHYEGILWVVWKAQWHSPSARTLSKSRTSNTVNARLQ